MPPQATQFPVTVSQVVLAAVQRLFAQHALPELPQLPHAPDEQVPVMPLPHVLPDATQVALPPVALATQHPPLVQELLSQQA